jgi:serine/threonine-protein kinase
MTQAPQKQMVGRVLAGRYHIEGVLGRGAMGSVYRTRDTQTNRVCAIKLMAQFASLDESAYLRFIQEAQIVAQLYHPNIVQVYGFDRDEDGTPILAMELLEGDDLHTLLYDQPRMPLERTLEILRGVGQALHAAHSVGVLHRDIKPKNIFVAKQKNSRGEVHEVVKVVDFGLSKVLGGQSANETAPGIILGTAEYISPEGTLGVPELLDFRADQWALGVVAYRLLSGRLPFEGNDPLSLLLAIRKTMPKPLRELVSDVPEHVLAAVERAMAKNKEDRFDTVQDFLRALDGLPPIGQLLSRSSDGVPALTGLDFSRRSMGSSMSGSLRLQPGGGAGSGRHPLAGAPSSRSASSSGEQPASARSGRHGGVVQGPLRSGNSDRVAPVAAAMTADALPSMPPRSLFRTLEPGSEYSVHVTGHLVGSSGASADGPRQAGRARQLWVFLAVPTIALSTAGLLWLGQTHLAGRRSAGSARSHTQAASPAAPLPALAAPAPTTSTAPSVGPAASPAQVGSSAPESPGTSAPAAASAAGPSASPAASGPAPAAHTGTDAPPDAAPGGSPSTNAISAAGLVAPAPSPPPLAAPPAMAPPATGSAPPAGAAVKPTVRAPWSARPGTVPGARPASPAWVPGARPAGAAAPRPAWPRGPRPTPIAPAAAPAPASPAPTAAPTAAPAEPTAPTAPPSPPKPTAAPEKTAAPEPPSRINVVD